LEVVGPFPTELQQNVVFTAAVGSETKEAIPGKALIEYLKAPAAVAIIRSKGMTPSRSDGSTRQSHGACPPSTSSSQANSFLAELHPIAPSSQAAAFTGSSALEFNRRAGAQGFSFSQSLISQLPSDGQIDSG
jgi:hypothetical protein